MIEDIKLLSAYMTVNSETKDEAIAVAHSVMNRMMNSLGSAMTDSMPQMSQEKTDKFIKIVRGLIKKDDENVFKRNMIYASAVINGSIDDPTNGADSFSSEKVQGSKKIGELYFSKSQTEGVISEQPSKPGRKKRKMK